MSYEPNRQYVDYSRLKCCSVQGCAATGARQVAVGYDDSGHPLCEKHYLACLKIQLHKAFGTVKKTRKKRAPSKSDILPVLRWAHQHGCEQAGPLIERWAP